MSNTLNRHQELRRLLERLKLSAMADNFADLALKAAKEGLSHEIYLHELAQKRHYAKSGAQNGCGDKVDCLWKRRFGLLISSAFPLHFNSKSSA
jgi:hypothetical protein